MFTLVATEYFLRRSRKFLRRHPDLEDRYARAIEALGEDPFAPGLNCHPLAGRFQGSYAISVTFNYRITFTIQVTEKEIVLLDVGSHDEVYG